MAELIFTPARLDAPYVAISVEEAWHQLITLETGATDWKHVTKPSQAGWDAREDAIRAAGERLQQAVSDGSLVAYVSLPRIDTLYRVPLDYWDNGFHDLLAGTIFSFPSEGRVPSEFDNRPVLIMQDAFSCWASRSDRHVVEAPKLKRSRGRPRGSGSYATADRPLHDEMRRLIASGEAFSPHDAAMKVADQAVGAGTFESRVSRLTKWFRPLDGQAEPSQ